MPGHAIGHNSEAIEELRKDIDKLEGLIKEHDTDFLAH